MVDLRTKLGLPKAEPTQATRIIILDIPVNGRVQGVGFVADRVFEVASLDEGQTTAAPEVGGRWRSSYIAAIGRRGGAFVIIFELQRLMGADELTLLPADDVQRAFFLPSDRHVRTSRNTGTVAAKRA